MLIPFFEIICLNQTQKVIIIYHSNLELGFGNWEM